MPTIKRKYIPDAGSLNHKIVIERKTYSDPVDGYSEEVWAVIYEPRCAISNNTGKEYIEDGVELYNRISKKFTFRTHPRIPIAPSDRILYDGEYYNDTSVYDYDDNKMYTVAVAQRSE